MAYRIEIEMVEGSKFHHAMYMWNAILKLIYKFGNGNFRTVYLREDGNYLPLVSLNCEPTVCERLKREMASAQQEQKEQVEEAIFRRIPVGDNPQ